MMSGRKLRRMAHSVALYSACPRDNSTVWAVQDLRVLFSPLYRLLETWHLIRRNRVMLCPRCARLYGCYTFLWWNVVKGFGTDHSLLREVRCGLSTASAQSAVLDKASDSP